MTGTRCFNRCFNFFWMMTIIINEFNSAFTNLKFTLNLETTTNTAKAF